ncbi:MAG: hypothetical protein ACXACR_06150, partial [Candidatus Hodarchaeales archaeon]
MLELIKTLTSGRLGILYILKMVPLDLWDYKPEPSMRTTSKLANHLACGPMITLEVFKGKVPDEETYLNLEKDNMPFNAQGLVKLYETGLSELITYLEQHIE